VGRRRRKIRRVVVRRRTIPKIFNCPNCGARAVNVKKVKDEESGTAKYVVVCGACGLKAIYDEKPGWAPVDYYNAFVDDFTEGRIAPPAEKPQQAEAVETGEYVGEEEYVEEVEEERE